MADQAIHSIGVRLSLMDGNKFKADFRDATDDPAKSLAKIVSATKPANDALKAVDAAVNDVKEVALEATREIGPLGSALAQLGPAGLVVGAGLGAVAIVLKESFAAGSEAERSFNRITAVLKATGGASGQTAKELQEYAEQSERATLNTSEQVLNAASVLATFRGVSGDTFTRALDLAQDLSTVFGMDLTAASKQLGKALEEPVEGLTALRRVGVVFTDSQKDLIKSLVESGQQAAAQKVILDALQQKVGGAAAGEKQGLVGAVNDVSDSWDNFLKDLGRTPEVAGVVETVLGKVQNAIEQLREKAQPSFGQQISDVSAQLKAAQDELAHQQQNSAVPIIGALNEPNLVGAQAQVDKLQAKLNKIIEDGDKELAADRQTEAKAQSDKQSADQQDRIDQIVEQKKKIDDALDKLVTDPSAKIAKVNDELAKTKANLNNMRDGTNDSTVDGAINEAEKLAKAQIDGIQKPAMEAAKNASEANAKVVAELERGLTGIGDKRQAYIDQAVAKLSKDAGSDEQAKVRDMAGKLFDQQQDQEAQKVIDELTAKLTATTDKRAGAIQEALQRIPKGASDAKRQEAADDAGKLYDQQDATDKLNKLREEAKGIIKENQSATDGFSEAQDKLNKMLAAGVISQDVYSKALQKAHDEELKNRTDPDAGVQRAFAAYQKQADDSASAVEKAFTDAMSATDEAITNTLLKGTNGFQALDDIAMSVITDITKMFVQKNITAPIYGSLSGMFADGGSLSGVLGSIFHAGGVAGGPAPQRSVPAEAFLNAPRYHTGGIAGLKPDEVPAILQKGETVLPKGAKRNGDQQFNFNVTVSGPAAGNPQLAAQSGRALAQAMRASILDVIQDQKRSGGMLYGG